MFAHVHARAQLRRARRVRLDAERRAAREGDERVPTMPHCGVITF
jgi:hypothetical protein